MPDDLILEILKAIQSDMSTMKNDIAQLKRDAAEQKQITNVLIQDGRMIRAALADLGKTRVSAGEIEAIHGDLNDLTVRVARLESQHST